MKLLVTGATGGIGGAVVRLAQAKGHEVVAFNRADFEALAETNGELPLEAGIDGLDGVVFATGTCPVRPLSLTSDILFAQTMQVNCGYFLALMRALVSRRRYAASGMKVIAVSSVSAVEGWPGGAAYCASKGALSALCRALTAELRAKRIAVEALEPRYIRTRMFAECAGRMGVSSDLAMPPEEFAAEILSKLEN